MLGVEGVFNPESFIMYQIAGPRSLELIECVTGEDFYDLEYFGYHAYMMNRTENGFARFLKG